MIVVRHAAATISGICYGRADVKVNRTPTAAAATVCRELIEAGVESIETVYSSPSERCASVARVLASEFEVPLQEDSRLMELDFGRWENRSWDEISHSDSDAFEEWMSAWQSASTPQGECLPKLVERLDEWFTEARPNERTLVMTHAGPIRALRRKFGLDRSWTEAFARPIPHLTPMIILSNPIVTRSI